MVLTGKRNKNARNANDFIGKTTAAVKQMQRRVGAPEKIHRITAYATSDVGELILSGLSFHGAAIQLFECPTVAATWWGSLQEQQTCNSSKLIYFRGCLELSELKSIDDCI